MISSSPLPCGVDEQPVETQALGTERLLGIPEICHMTGFCPVTASRFMKESGRCIRVHKRLFMLESSFFAYIRELEEEAPC